MSTPPQENFFYDGIIRMPYNWAVGKTGSFFLTQLHNHAHTRGSRCPGCEMVFKPPRKNFLRCLVTDTTWAELPPRGVLETFTVVHFSEPSLQLMEPPYIYGIVKLDGAGTGLTHLVREIEPDSLCPGMRMEAVFKPDGERVGQMQDILHFKVSEEKGG